MGSAQIPKPQNSALASNCPFSAYTAGMTTAQSPAVNSGILSFKSGKNDFMTMQKEAEEAAEKAEEKAAEEKKIKLEKEKSEFETLCLADLKDKRSSVDTDLLYDIDQEISKKEEEKKDKETRAEVKQKDELSSLDIDGALQKKNNVLPKLKDFFQKLIPVKQKEAEEKKCKTGGAQIENGMQVCQHAAGEASRGGGKTDGPEQGSCDILVKAHESAAKHCRQIAEKFGDTVKACKKGIANTWTKIADCIEASKNTAQWKQFSGGVYATCRSDGKTCYNPKLKNNQIELEKTIVHECIHYCEFKSSGDSDEKDTYNTEKEYEKNLKQLGINLGGKSGSLGG